MFRLGKSIQPEHHGTNGADFEAGILDRLRKKEQPVIPGRVFHQGILFFLSFNRRWIPHFVRNDEMIVFFRSL
jgi:hypothetical protein